MIFGKSGEVLEEDFTVVASDGTLVTGLVDGNFTRKLYDEDGNEVSGSITITITELDNGNYRASFTPDNPGMWFMVIYHATYFPWGKSDSIQVFDNDFDSIDDSLDNIALTINDMTSSINNMSISLDNVTIAVNDMTSSINDISISLDNIALSINDMTSSINNMSISLDNVVIAVNDMTNSINYISSEIDTANISLTNLTSSVNDITDLITRSLGLSQENQYLDNSSYDENNNLTSCRIRIYSNASDVGSTSSVIATYHVTAGYTGELLDYYKVVKQ